MSEKRELVFISHANPEDNDFTLWLASRLTAMGYLVWSDVTKLFGAEQFWEDIEDAIRNHSKKIIVVLSRTAQNKPGVLDEIAVAVSTERTQQIERFVVPIRIDDLPFDEVEPNLTRKNIIDFSRSWASGLHQLIKVLERDNVPLSLNKSVADISSWLEQTVARQQRIISKPQSIITNWLYFSALPDTLNFYCVPVRSNKLREKFEQFSYPANPYRDMIATFASKEDVNGFLPRDNYATLAHSIPLNSILQGDQHSLSSLEWPEASRMLSYLIRTAWDNEMHHKGLRPYYMSNAKKAWYPANKYCDDGWTRFVDINGSTKKRRLVGYSNKRKVFWHFSMEVVPFIGIVPHIVLKPHVVFSEDGKRPLESQSRMHSLRRSFCRLWWNERWRDLMLAYVSLLANGKDTIEIPVGSGSMISINSKTLILEAPVSVSGLKTMSASEDETDAELDELIDETYYGYEEETNEENKGVEIEEGAELSND